MIILAFSALTWFGILCMFFLILMSMLSWYSFIVDIISHIFFCRKTKYCFDRSVTTSFKVDEQELLIFISKSSLDFCNILKTKLKYDIKSELISVKINEILMEQKIKANSNLTILGTIAGLSPFVGLLGTIYGIMHTLQNISMMESISMKAVAGPVGETLLMTGVGLIVAIPAVIFYNISVKNLKIRIYHINKLLSTMAEKNLLGFDNGL
jgi:biopolymer transport protein ExbB